LFKKKADQSGNNVKMYERHVYLDIDDDFDGIGDQNYDNAPLDHGDQFGQPRNYRYEGVMRDRKCG
jgi:hypothetical protein